MKNPARFALSVGAALFAGCGGLQASAIPGRSVVPYASETTSEGVTYHGGPVLVNPKVYLIFWGYRTYGDPNKVARLLTDYVAAMGGSRHNNIYTQYFEQATTQRIYITNPTMQLGGVWYDQTNGVPAGPTDSQVAQEALAGATHFGGYDPNGSYVVATPHGRSTSGFGTQWCAYHSITLSGSNMVSYTNLPYVPDAGKQCGADAITPPKDESAADEGVTIAEGAEEGDSVTDPNPGASWYSATAGEISNACGGATHIRNDRFGNRSYTVGSMFSNASGSCVQKYK
jgi:serine protease